MTHVEPIPPRDRWKSKLEVYRSALAHALVMHGTCDGVTDSFSVSTRVATEPQRPLEVEQAKVAHSDLPFSIDGIVKQVRRNRPYLLGVGTLSGVKPQVYPEIIVPMADQLSQAMNRKTLVIQVGQDQNTALRGSPAPSSAHSLVRWQTYGESTLEKKSWYAQLAFLPPWRQAFDLIILDMGDPESPTFERLGRLCDGLVVQWGESTADKPLIQKLKRIQMNYRNIIGVWSICQAPVASVA